MTGWHGIPLSGTAAPGARHHVIHRVYAEPKAKKTGFSWQDYFTGRELSPEERQAVLEDLCVFGQEHQSACLMRMGVLLVLSTVIAAAGAVVMGWPQRRASSARPGAAGHHR